MSNDTSKNVVARYLSASDGVTVREGDKVEVRTRKGWLEATIVRAYRNPRARKFPYVWELRLTSGQDAKIKAKSERYADSDVVRYVGKSDLDVEEEARQFVERKLERADKKDEIHQRGRDAIDDLNLKEGDVVQYKYRNGIKNELIVGINWKTGKIGVPRYTPEQESRRRHKREMMDLRDEMLGFKTRKRPDRSTRWIPAENVLKVLDRG